MSLEIIEELKKCFQCNSLIRIPKVLPCGQSICSNCSVTLSSFFCNYCKKQHLLNDLAVNQAHYKFLELISKLNYPSEIRDLPEQRQEMIQTRNEITSDNDTSNKIAYLNNEFKYRLYNLSNFLEYKPIRKLIKVLNDNLVLFVTEVFHGKINTTYLQLISNYRIVNEKEINNHLFYFFSCCANDKKILLVFSNGKKHFDLRLFDLSLNLIVSKLFNFEINKIIMNETNIYVLSDYKKIYIREYGFELVKLAKFGQNKNSKRSFYIPGNVINVTSDKIFTKHENCITVLSKGKGEVLLKFNVDDLSSSSVFLDKMNNYLVYNGFSKLSLYNSTGELIKIQNKQFMMSDNESSSPAYYDNLNSTNLSYLSPKMSSDLANHLVNLKQKVDTINNGYQLGRNKIEKECQKVISDINKATEQLIKEIINKRDVMINDVELYQRDVLLDYQERYENNPKFEANKSTINSAYAIILDDLAAFNSKKNVSEEDGRLLIEKTELLVSKLNDACTWLIPDPSPSIGIVFTKNNADIQIPFIGDITYDSVNKVDIVAKITYLNNLVQQRVYKIDHVVEDHLFQKHITLISKNKLLVLYEKVYGKVISVFAKIVYYNGSILHKIEVCNSGSLSAFCVYDNYILLDFRKSKNDHVLYMYDTNLKYIQDQPLNFEVQSLLMNKKTIFVICEKKPFIREYDERLKLTRCYGQKSKENSSFYLKGEVIGINDMKIFVKLENELRLISRSSGELLSKITFDDLKSSKICLDYHKEKYIAFNGFDKVSYYNHKGEMIISNKLRTGHVFDHFKFSRSGHFAFVNHKENLVLII